MTQTIHHKNLTTRRAVRADLPRLLELLADDVLGQARDAAGSDDSVYVQAFEAIDTDANQYLLLGELDGRVIGMLQLSYIPGLSRRGALRANIETVRVDSSLRGQGIGHWIIAQALRLARERGCNVAQLTSDKTRTEAHRFYARLGFSASHEGFKIQLTA
ncbi:GNAT family N-acetyltransferase [Janthinobacterium agaricidamnosum]|uniref:Transcriptional regulator n=1 Tax=Janthinobacterium agaricidamnosum NBRC 102515 = DSM 9628 TaxID=1349767 RepID=W0V6T0_9BURK|nr:GNAT family N-acetyltransferase [Janthinobacterium agaricidamnosum]CDG82952.1 transcriptional regulator [Janthinobacterium agaricidamnosum NBRC 102515 = DSM 9628]